MKFKIGDTVEVVKYVNSGEGCEPPRDFRKGHRGKVTGYDRNYAPFPYTVERKNGKWDQFNVKELKLIRKGK
jgi:hypothetical protein